MQFAGFMRPDFVSFDLDRALPGFTRFHWVLPSFTGFSCFFLLGFTGFHLVLPSFTGFYWVLLGFI